MERLLLTRAEIEDRLERGLVGKQVSFTWITDQPFTGKLQRIAVEVKNAELIVTFIINSKRYEADLYYFVENTIIHYGVHYPGDQPSIRGILQKDRSGG